MAEGTTPPPTPPATSTARAPCLDSVIRAEGLSHWFGQGETRTPAVVDLTIEIDRGEIVILTGPSGSGKTTLLTLIGALRRVQQGGLRVLGRDLSRLDQAALVRHRGDIGFIFQQHNLFSSLSAVENVRMATAMKPASVREMNRRASAVLERIGMGDRLHHLPSKLSGGQRQRVAIARALVNEPSLVLADEPTASLDAASGQEVMNLLNEMANGPGKATVLIVTHDQRLLDRAHRIINMVNGRLVSNVQPARVILISRTLKDYFPALRGLDAGSMTRLVEHMTVRRVPAGETLVRGDEEGDAVHVILDGVVEALDARGEVADLYSVAEAFGRITTLSGIRTEFTARSRTPIQVATLTRAQADRAFENDSELVDAIKQYLMARQ